MTEISIIIRTFNEERWIGKCLKRLKSQTIDDFDVVLVDNVSTDKTVEKAIHVYPNLEFIEIDDYLPGFALNEGIHRSSGEFVTCLSAHCIPVDKHWLETLQANFDEYNNVAGVYGRQVPIKSSDPTDKLDLIRTFGPEKRVQTRDTFFHNANSMLRREVWEEFPFNENVTNIEDQIWAKEVLHSGCKIIYEPDAAVYHHHGINQGNDKMRTQSVVRTMERNLIEVQNETTTLNPLDPVELDIVSFVPLREKVSSGVDTNQALMAKTLLTIDRSRYVDDICISTDSESLTEKAADFGAVKSFLRPPELSAEEIGVDEVYKFTLEQLEKLKRYPDLVVTLDITHPFRPPGFLDDIIKYTIKGGYDSVVPVYQEFRPSWMEDKGRLIKLNEHDIRLSRMPVQVGLNSLGVVTYPDNLRDGNRITGDVGLYPITNPLATIEIRDQEDLQYWEKLQQLPEVFDA